MKETSLIYSKKKSLEVWRILETCFVVIGLFRLCCKLLILCCARKYTHTHTHFFSSKKEILKRCIINPLSTCLIVIGCASDACSKETYWVCGGICLKLCERIATKRKWPKCCCWVCGGPHPWNSENVTKTLTKLLVPIYFLVFVRCQC